MGAQGQGSPLRRHPLTLLAVLASSAMACGAACQSGPPARNQATLAITNVTVVAMAGGGPQSDRTVLVTGDRITRVGAAGEITVPAGARVLDGTGRFLIPGLWDMHAHTSCPDRDIPLQLANGITGIRDMGGEAAGNPARTPGTFSIAWDALRPIRDGIRAGRVQGPRIVAGGVMLDAPKPWPGTQGVADAEDARRTVTRLRDERVDFIKVGSGVEPDAFAALLDEARAAGLPLAGHVPRGKTALAVEQAGQRSIEHVMGLPGGCFADAGPDAACLAELRAVAATGVSSVPTLVAWRGRLVPADVKNDPALRYVAGLADRWARDAAQADAAAIANGRRTFPRFLAAVGAQRTAGLRILAGTDCANAYVVPGFALHEELRLLVQAGLTPAEALAAATSQPAQFLGLAGEVGTITDGQRADLVLLEADPLADIAHTARLSAVVLGGAVLDRVALDGLLKRALEAKCGTGD